MNFTDNFCVDTVKKKKKTRFYIINCNYINIIFTLHTYTLANNNYQGDFINDHGKRSIETDMYEDYCRHIVSYIHSDYTFQLQN